MKLPLPPRRARAGIDMVPMINFAFLLLIFFLLAGRLGSVPVLTLNPPTAPVQASQAGEQVPALQLDATGQFAVMGETVDYQDLPARAEAWQAQHPGETLLLAADAQADAVLLVHTMELLRAAGVSELRLLTRPIGP